MLRAFFILLTSPIVAGAALLAQTHAQSTVADSHDFFTEELYPRWSTLTPQRIEADVTKGILLAHERIEHLLAVTPQTATFENSFAVYYLSTKELDDLREIRNFLASRNALSDDAALAYHRMSRERSACFNRLAQPAIKQLLQAAETAPQLQNASPEQKRCMELTLRSLPSDFTREQEEKIDHLHTELSKACEEYENNLHAARSLHYCLFTTRDELSGIPPHVVDSMAQSAMKHGYATPEQPAWLITAEQEPQVLAICKYATSPTTRKRVWDMCHSVACTPPYDNAPLTARIMQLKQELATLYGYRTYPQLRLRERITGNAEQALAYIDNALEAKLPSIKEEHAAILRMVSEEQGRAVQSINTEDSTYYRNKLSTQQNRFNLLELRPYLEFEHTLHATLDYLGELYGLRITEVPTAYVAPGSSTPSGHAEIWVPGIRLFAVHNAEDGTHYGSFYLDAYKRPNNTVPTSCQMLRIGTRTAEGHITMPHLAVMQLQLEQPPAGKPHLLTHLELRMLFHELGHILHMLLSHAQTPNLAAAYMSLDAVEIPALMNERRAWEPDVLCRIARHHVDGSSLPPKIAQKAAQQRTNTAGDNSILLSLLMSKIDLELHLHYHEKFHGKDSDNVINELLAPWFIPGEQTKGLLQRSKDFICFGYDSCFYAYPLAEMMAEDMFSIYIRNGIDDPATAQHYRKCILEAGNSASAQQIYQRFFEAYRMAEP